MGIAQYLKDTRSELNHVAWPTRVQTVVFTMLVVTLSILISLYLGLFDFLFTRGLAAGVSALPQNAQPELQLDTAPATGTTPTEIPESFNLTGTSTQ